MALFNRFLQYRAQKRLLHKAQSIIGKTGYELNALGTFDKTQGDNAKNKGYLGNIIQENVFGLSPNNTTEPDFIDERLELKVIGVRKHKNGTWVAKERMVANIIDFTSEDTSGDIRKSSFWKKNRMMLIVMYEAQHKDILANTIIGAFILDLSKASEFQQLEDDYRVINSHIAHGSAHEISGKQTVFLEACTKGAGRGRDLRPQKNSTILAKQRAYALKTKFMNPIVNSVLQAQ